MTHEFKAGDKVRALDGYDPRVHRHNVKQGDVREVARITREGHVLLVPQPGDTHGPDYTFSPNAFAPVPDWTDVEVGDKITFRFNRTGEEFTAEAYERYDEVAFLGWTV
jgi:hypothetical protein